MKNLLIGSFLLIYVVVIPIYGRPPMKKKAQPREPEINATQELDLGIEYNRYLQEVVQVLESDPEFRKKLEASDSEKIKDGSIASELDFVNHNVRSQLDDIKRRELERLRHYAMRQHELNEGIDRRQLKIPHHINVLEPSFEKEDLVKLIRSTSKDLEEADKKRREDFKRYEMEKKFEQHERLNHIDDEVKRKEEETRLKDLEEKHKKHEKPHHPMTKDQLEEVWEEQDHMRPEDWDPKTFFAMHDLNGDGFLDEDEMRALFSKELDKVYDKNAPEDDMREREEEMERMREHVFGEADKNKDRLLSFDEFMAETKRDEFENDPGWNTLDEDHDAFTDEEYRAYEMQRQREIQDLLNRGIIPEGYPYFGELPPGAAPYQVPQMGVPQHHQQMGIPGQPAYHAPSSQQDGQQYGQPQQFAQPGQQFGQGQPLRPQQPGHASQHQLEQQQFGQQPHPGMPQQYAQQPQAGVPQQQFAQQPQAGVPQQQFAQQPQAAVPQQQFAQQPQAGVPQQQFAQQPQAGVPQQGQAPQPRQVPQGQAPPQPRQVPQGQAPPQPRQVPQGQAPPQPRQVPQQGGQAAPQPGQVPQQQFGQPGNPGQALP